MTAWTTGEPGAPLDVAAVYRAVLDEIFPPGASGPRLIVVDQTTEPGLMETDPGIKRNRARPRPVIAPFNYRIPITFLDSAGLYELFEKGRTADSISYTVPTTDARYYSRDAGPFIERYPGAWGRLSLGRVGIGRASAYAAVEVRYTPFAPYAEWGRELFRLVRKDRTWKVVERIPREKSISAEPVPHAMLHGRIDSTSLPAPRRRSVRGTVKDSASGRPLAAIVIRIKAAPLGKQGQILWDKGPEEWGTVFTDSAGKYVLSNPPSGYAWVEAECPPSGDVRGAGLAPAALQPEAGLDTVLDFRVRFASCAELAPALAREAEEHRKRVEHAKVEAAARAVQATIWGTLRDSRTGRPVPRAPIRVDERGGVSGSDSLGRFWLWGVAAGTRKIIVYCPLRRQWLGKVATTVTIHAPPAMKDTMVISVDTQRCADVPVDTVRVRTQGVYSTGFEDGFFTPCRRFDQIKLGGYRDFSGWAYLEFAESVVAPPGGWPNVKPDEGYYKTFLEVEGDLIGPGAYGHMGVAIYQLHVTRVVSAKAASKTSCAESR